MKSSKMNQLVIVKAQKLHKMVLLLFICCSIAFVLSNAASYSVMMIGAEKFYETDVTSMLFVNVNNFTYENFLIGFLVIIYQINLFLEVIEKFLDQVLSNKETYSVEEIEKLLLLVKTLMIKICDALENITHCYLSNTYAFLNYFALFNVFSIYGFVALYMRDSSSTDLIFSCVAAFWTLYNSIFFIFTFVVSNWIKKKGRNIEAKSFNLLCKFGFSPKICKSVVNLSLQLEHRRPMFSCAFFVVDWKLLLHLLGFCFTYIIILIQFEYKF